ncbi:hypothetical protein AHF37_01096, partial [Paragonimus kellicotti]
TSGTVCVHTTCRPEVTVGAITPINYSLRATPIVMTNKANGSACICTDCLTGGCTVLRTLVCTDVTGQTFRSSRSRVDQNPDQFSDVIVPRSLFHNCLPVRVVTTAALFQQVMCTMLIGFPSEAIYLDGKAPEEPLERQDDAL